MSDDEYKNNIDSLSADQKVSLSLIDSFYASNNTLHLFVTGGPGTGKSFLLKVMREHLLRKNISAFPNVLVAAPTGVAAYNVKGWTLHSLLNLDVQHKQNAAYHKLSAKTLQKLRRLFRSVTVLIIDEISMVSINTFIHIHKRLTEIKDISEPHVFFGKLHIIAFGDLFQLRPPFGSFVFKDHADLTECHLWRDLFHCHELQQNFRQRSDNEYAALLNRIRLGTHTTGDIITLHSRKGPADNMNNLHIFPKRLQCRQYNDAAVSATARTPDNVTTISAIDEPSGVHLHDDDSQNGGLQTTLSACVNARIMLIRNIHTQTGLVNGARGCIQSFTWKNGHSKSAPNETPSSINVLFDDRNVGSIFSSPDHSPVSIKPISVQFYSKDKRPTIRTQFPISISYAVTVHKVQGLTLDSASIDNGNTIFEPGMAYVSLSRFPTLSGLAILDINPNKIYASKAVHAEMVRLKSKGLPPAPTSTAHSLLTQL